MVTRILLTTPVNGYLDIKDNTAFPINMSLGDIRDISKRNGSFSKTITLVGNDNNNRLLGYLFDVNITDSTFNVNTLQECLVEQDGVVILDNMYLQLTAVKKYQKSGGYEEYVEYECEIRDSASDFFTKINQKELSDIDLSYLSHTYSVANIVSSYDNTYLDGYKYMLPFKQREVTLDDLHLKYDLKEFKPAVYSRVYWDKIFDSAGYTYQFDQMDDLDIQFSKLLHPYNGGEVKQDENPDFYVEADNTSVISKQIFGGFGNDAFSARVSPNGSNAPSQIIIDNEITDPTNQYNPVTGIYTPAVAITNPSSLNFKFLIDYEIEIIVSGTGTLLNSIPGGSNGIRVKPGFITRNNTQGVENIQYFDEIAIPIGTVYSGTNTIGSGTIGFETTLSDLTTTSQVVEKLYLSVYDTAPNAAYPAQWRNGSFVVIYPSYRIKITSINMQITPKDLPLDFGMVVDVNKMIPAKIKQSDFISSICKMYNLYIEVDPENKTNLIIRTRDEFYDSGNTVDWTYKLAKDRDQNLKFLPELSNKSIILTYKEDTDTANAGYLANVGEIYGQVRYIFENEYVKGESKRELIFSPTPTQPTAFGAVVPIINGDSPKTNMRVLYDGGSMSCSTYYIKQNGSFISVNNYAHLSHFDKPYEPTFDINYAKCDFYFYDPTSTTDGTNDVTNNNLYNLHWRRTLSQINNGKLLSAYFNLSPIDIKTIKLNDKIRIDNSYWNINKIIDYNANANDLTLVELISIDDEATIDIDDRTVTVISVTDEPIIDVVLGGPGKGGGGGGPANPGGWGVGNNGPNTVLNGFTDIKGGGNFVGPNNITSVKGDNNFIVANGISTVYGNENKAYSPTNIYGSSNSVDYAIRNSTIYGDSNIIDAGSENVLIYGNGNLVGSASNNVFIFGVGGYTVSESNQFIIPENLVLVGNTPSINGIPFPSGFQESLEETLAIGNDSGTYSIIMGTSTSIKSGNGGGQIDLDAFGTPDSILLSTDNGGYSETQLYLDNVIGFELSSYLPGADSVVSSNRMKINGNDVGLGYNALAFGVEGTNVQARNNTTTQATTLDVDMTATFIGSRSGIIGTNSANSVIIGGAGNEIVDNVDNVVILGGNIIIATQSNTAYVDRFNIKTLGTTPAVQTLGIDADGYVVVGTSSTGGTGTTPSLSQVLAVGNDSGTYSIIMGTSTTINTSNGSSYLALDNAGVASDVNLSNGTDCNLYLAGDSSIASLFSITQARIESDNTTNIIAGGNINLGIQGSAESEIQITSNGVLSATSSALDKRAIFIGTNNSSIDAGVVNSVIMAGGNNQILNGISNSAYWSVIVGGDTNIINGGDYNSIFGGSENTINDQATNNDNVILGGNQNTLQGRWSVMAGGRLNDLSGNNSIILGGSLNSISLGGSSGILFGGSNTINNGSRQGIIAGETNTISSSSNNNTILGGNTNIIQDTSEASVIVGGNTNTIKDNATDSSIVAGRDNTLNSNNSAIIASLSLTAESYERTLYNQDNYHDAFHTVTTTNATITNLYTFTPTNGVYHIEWDVTGFESATGDAIVSKSFAAFKVIAGVVTQVSTTTLDRKSNFPAAVTVTIDTDGTVIRARVTGRAGSTIVWRGHLKITK